MPCASALRCFNRMVSNSLREGPADLDEPELEAVRRQRMFCHRVTQSGAHKAFRQWLVESLSNCLAHEASWYPVRGLMSVQGRLMVELPC
jgi:hypothetical protein